MLPGVIVIIDSSPGCGPMLGCKSCLRDYYRYEITHIIIYEVTYGIVLDVQLDTLLYMRQHEEYT